MIALRYTKEVLQALYGVNDFEIALIGDANDK